MTRRSVFIVAVLLAACGSTAVELANEHEEVPANILPEASDGGVGDAGEDNTDAGEADAGENLRDGGESEPDGGFSETDGGSEEVDHDDCEKKCKKGHGHGDKNHCHEHKK